MIDDCTSIHEPGTPWLTKPDKWTKQLKKFGLYHMTIGQLKPSHSMFKLSTDRVRKDISEDRAKFYIHNMRKYLLDNMESNLYVESSGHIYGLLDLIDEVFPNSKFIFIIRDPRDWVRSALNTYEYILYGPLDLDFLDISLKAKDIKEDEFHNKWNEMSKFEKYCWYYNKLNGFVFEKMKFKENFTVYRHEDLFSIDKRDNTFVNMLNFASKFEDGFSKKIDYKKRLMDNKIHSNSQNNNIPHWKNWDKERVRILYKHCRTWMKLFGYGEEEKWQQKIS